MNAETVVLGARDVATVPYDSRVHRRHSRNATCSRSWKESRAGPPAVSRSPAGASTPSWRPLKTMAGFRGRQGEREPAGQSDRHGRPTIQGALILLDGDDGQPLAIMDSIALTSLRTAAVAALAAQQLALSEEPTITICRLWRAGKAQLCAMAVVRPLRAGFAVEVDSAAATAILAKVDVEGVPSTLATAIRTVVVTVFAWAMVFGLDQQRALPTLSTTHARVTGVVRPGHWRIVARVLPRIADGAGRPGWRRSTSSVCRSPSFWRLSGCVSP